MDMLQDLKISGMSRMNGGKFEQVDISGVGKIFGDIEANSVKISGSAKIEGNVKTVKMNIEGNGNIGGNIECEQLGNSGRVIIGGNLKADLLHNEGMSRIGGSIKAKKIFSRGVLKSGADVEADEFDLEGAFNINGLLNANRINARIGFGSSAREIGGEEIVVKKAKNMGFGLALLLIGKSKWLEVDLVEGTNVSLEYTQAKIVRGENIKIGPKCIIEVLEYSGNIEIDPSSVVKSQKKVE